MRFVFGLVAALLLAATPAKAYAVLVTGALTSSPAANAALVTVPFSCTDLDPGSIAEYISLQISMTSSVNALFRIDFADASHVVQSSVFRGVLAGTSSDWQSAFILQIPNGWSVTVTLQNGILIGTAQASVFWNFQGCTE